MRNIGTKKSSKCFKEILSDVSKYWGMAMPNANEINPDKIISIRSDFKCNLIKLSNYFGFSNLESIFKKSN